eukprot:CAMPEP_0180283256 /NCGR_PEP_ID=MMETSP0988-20121125/10362_1 /TAXON_ID=697907 /ORGANISM="non described non described, Strain CCMP2293" /LENGTH=73 /DNA_ID=CAMNT_0022255743 /DNA_START=249 /DNA_END=468 /DNA_ORIENTATION=-
MGPIFGDGCMQFVSLGLGGGKWDEGGGGVGGIAKEGGEGVEVMEFAIGSGVGDWCEADFKEGEEGLLDVGASD